MSDSMKRCGRSQTDQGEILDDCCHVTSTLGTLHFKDHVISITKSKKVSRKVCQFFQLYKNARHL